MVGVQFHYEHRFSVDALSKGSLLGGWLDAENLHRLRLVPLRFSREAAVTARFFLALI